MKSVKKWFSLLLCTVLICGVMGGCATGSGTSDGSTADSSATDSSAEGTESTGTDDDTESSEVEAEVATFGDEDGTPIELWTFVELHGTYYGTMVEKWNKENSDRKINLTATTYPYSDMHAKLLMTLQAGTGAPDIVDVEVGQFPNVVAGMDTWLVPLDDYITPYQKDIVASRLETYMGSDGHYYGAPYHVGATIMYYNLGVMEEYGFTQADIDAVVTWDDWADLGARYVEAVDEDGKYWTSLDTLSVDWMWLAMGEYGDDWTGGFDDPANVELDSVKNMLTQQVSWLDSGIAEVSPDGHVDLEAGFQNILDHNIVSFPKAAWYMSRFLDYMPEEEGRWYLAPCPVFEKGQNRSVGIGGTGTVVTQQSENQELAAEFICWAKLSEEGNQEIWNQLGFDVCNTALWDDDSFAHDDSNKFNAFFRNYPYDVLNEIADEIGKISVVEISPTINEIFNDTTLNDVLVNGVNVEEALASAQADIDIEQ